MVDLAELAAHYGVATSFHDQSGDLRHVPESTVRDVLTSMGVDPDHPHALVDAHLRHWRAVVPPIVVMRSGEPSRVWVHVPHGTPVSGSLLLEDGRRMELAAMDWWVEPRDVDDVLTGEASFVVPGDVPIGWHRIDISCARGEHSVPLAVAPSMLPRLEKRSWGLMTQVYAMQSRQSWGIGDVADVVSVADWVGSRGADFVLVNPMHAAEPVSPMEASPYLPTTRRFFNPIYLRIEDIPEYQSLPAETRAEIALLRDSCLPERDDELIDRDLIWTAKRAALRAIFDAGRVDHREHEFDRFVAAGGQGLLDFATWCAIADVHGADISNWPSELGSPHASGIATFRARAASDIQFHQWLQWQMDQQLANAQGQAKAAGMAIGIMHDLAVGVHPRGADAWALADVLATGITVGAPPDMYNQRGQNWSQPPWRPDALRDAAYQPFRDMLQAMFRHSGGVRIDHILGLFRLWWIPKGVPPAAGTYVHYDHDELLGILALEAERAGAIVVGEDLGTVAEPVEAALASWGILGTSILWFERDADGSIRQPDHWRSDVLASVTVHDLPPTAGYLQAEHVRLRSELDLLTTDVEQEYASARRECDEWVALLNDAGDLDLDDSDDIQAIVAALYAIAARSPALLFGVSINDLVGDLRAVNQPGTDREYPNWRIRMSDREGRDTYIEDIQTNQLADRILNAVEHERP